MKKRTCLHRSFRISLLVFIIMCGAVLTAYSQVGPPLGDVNNNGTIDIVDALATAQYSVGLQPPVFFTSAGDVSGNGRIDIVDALIIAQYYVGIIDKFPAATLSPTPTPPVTPVPTQLELISNLVVGDSSHAAEWSIQSNIKAGDTIFGDRAFTITSLSSGYRGLDWIRTACDSKSYTGTTLVSFDVASNVDVFVAYDDRISSQAGWLGDWTDTGDNLSDNEPITFSLYKKNFAANTTVSLGNNGQTAGCVNYFILVNQAGPSAAFNYSPSMPLPDQLISFDASASGNPNGTLTAYSWDFGDSTSAMGSTVTHTYPLAGDYQVTLTVTGSDGATGRLTRTVTVHSGEPVASFSINPSTAGPGELITFNGSSSYDPDGSITIYSWDFGDGTSGSGEIVSHIYDSENMYTVSLSVTDDSGNTGSTSSEFPVSVGLKFVVYGDSRTNYRQHERIVDAFSLENPDLVIHTGDLWDGYPSSVWKEHLTSNPVLNDLLQNNLYLVARGNHESESEVLSFKPSIVRDNNLLYSFSQKNVFFVCAGYDIRENTEWIEQQLSSAEAQAAAWRFVYCHMPVYATRDNIRGASEFEALCDLYDVPMTFSSEVHIYERTHLIYNGQVASEEDIIPAGSQGTVYIVSGGGGAPLYNAGSDWWVNTNASEYHYCFIEALNDRIIFTAKYDDGATLDSLTIFK